MIYGDRRDCYYPGGEIQMGGLFFFYLTPTGEKKCSSPVIFVEITRVQIELNPQEGGFDIDCF